MDDFLPILVLVIIGILSAVSKSKARKQKKTDVKPNERGNLITRLNTFLTDMQKRLEAQAGPGAGTGSGGGWERLMGGTGPGKAPPVLYEEEESLEDLVLENIDLAPEPPKPKPVRQQRASRIKPAQKSEPSKHAPPRQPDLDGEIQKPRSTVIPKARGDLRKAVVWAEIIGPPLALRDPARSPGKWES